MVKRQPVRVQISEEQKQEVLQLERVSAQAETTTPVKEKKPVAGKQARKKYGHALRIDLVDQCELIAAIEKAKIYEVIEEGLQMVIESRKAKGGKYSLLET